MQGSVLSLEHPWRPDNHPHHCGIKEYRHGERKAQHLDDRKLPTVNAVKTAIIIAAALVMSPAVRASSRSPPLSQIDRAAVLRAGRGRAQVLTMKE
jgi:hypothetical protein